MNPNNVYKFVEKLNKVDGNTYTIEEVVEIKNGVYEGELEHDNVSNSSVSVYTGSKLSGEKVDNFILTIPSKMPWKRIIKIFTNAQKVYISYETVGDTVEAEDINKLQDGIVNIQNDLYKEIDRASNAEKTIGDALNSEIGRAMASEKVLNDNLNGEINRAKVAEKAITDSLGSEIFRAKESEKVLANNLDNETSRAKSAEGTLIANLNTTNANLNAESGRAKAAEKTITDTLNVEIVRAKDSEKALVGNLDSEINRAKVAEKVITDSLGAEIARAKDLEKALAGSIDNEISRAKSSEANLESTIKAYKKISDEEVQKLKDKDSELELKKADKTYADSELSKRYLKEQVFTKEEVLQKIKDVIGVAPQALDTLQEIAQALNNDSNFAGTITNKLSEKVDKVLGKQLSTEDYTTGEKQKLSAVEEKANNYIHPQTHDSSIIVENTNRRFTSDGEKNNWNDAYNKRHDHGNKLILDGISQALVDKWNTINNKADLNHTHSEYSKNGHIHDDRYYTEAEVDSRFVTKEQLGRAGYGDMVKDIYDKNNNGKVDIAEIAESIEWTNVKNKPNSLPASGGASDGINFIDNRSIDDKPKDLNSKRITAYFKSVASVGNPPVGANTIYVYILNVVGWSSGEESGGWPIQLAVGKEGLAFRQAIDGDTWGKWYKISNISDIPTKVSAFENDKKYITQSDLANSGYGDMKKLTYDKDNDGVIDYCKNADMIDGRHGSDFLLKNDNSLSVKVYKNLSSYNNNGANVTGAIIFHTKIPFTACAMLRFHFIGYTYDGNNGLEFVTSGYNYSNNAIHNYGTTYLSSYKPMVRWAKDSGGYLSIIIGDVGTVWQYPKVVIADVIESYNGNESYYSGWTTELVTNISTYEYVTNITENKTSKTWNDLKGV